MEKKDVLSIHSILTKRNNDSKTNNFNTIVINTINNKRVKRSRYSVKPNFQIKNKLEAAAYEIASNLNDLNNFAFHIWAVHKIGASEAIRLFKETLDDCKEQLRNKKTPIHKPAALYVRKVINLWKKKNSL